MKPPRNPQRFQLFKRVSRRVYRAIPPEFFPENTPLWKRVRRMIRAGLLHAKKGRYGYSPRAHWLYFLSHGSAKNWVEMSPKQRVRLTEKVLEANFHHSAFPERRPLGDRPEYSVEAANALADYFRYMRKKVSKRTHVIYSLEKNVKRPRTRQAYFNRRYQLMNSLNILDSITTGLLSGTIRWD